MKILVIATVFMVASFGIVAYIAAAGTLIIYALGNSKAKKWKRAILGLLGAVMLWIAIYTVIQIIKNR